VTLPRYVKILMSFARWQLSEELREQW